MSLQRSKQAAPCQDTRGWSNGYRHGCASYKARWCSNGGPKPGQGWTLGSKYNFPERNCCVCGKDAQAVKPESSGKDAQAVKPESSGNCRDTPGWSNGYR